VPESDFLQHMGRFGSDAYPVQKVSGGRWIWRECWGVKGAPTVYKTKRECVQAIERYIDVLIDKTAGRLG
jgi:hypothetical protein